MEELPIECWVRIVALSDDRSALLRTLPLVSRRCADTFYDPWLRSSLFRAIYNGAHEAGNSWWAEGREGGIVPVHVEGGAAIQLNFQQQLQRRSALSRPQQAQTSLMHFAIVRHSLRTCRQCILDGFDIQHQGVGGVTPLYLAMKHDFAEGLRVLLGVDDGDGRQRADGGAISISLPPPWHGCPGLRFTQMVNEWDPAFIGTTMVHAGQNLLQLSRAGVDTPGCCPLLTGVLYHSTATTRALLQLLLLDGTIVYTDANDTESMSGLDYARKALQTTFLCAARTSIRHPHFMCGSA